MKEIQLHRIDLNLLVVFEALMREGSVAGAATRLNKTPSAISHTLARLRAQVGDPLMVKVGGRMQASPFALQLVDDVQPILNSIKRVLKLPEPFHPAASTRIFRVGCPLAARILPQVVNRLQAQAPHASVEWLSTPRQVYAAVSEGLIDLAHLGGEMALPDGLDEVDLPPLRFVSLVRAGHPALADWGPEAWRRYPHVQVKIGNEVTSAVDAARQPGAPDRRVGALISDCAAVGHLVANSDMIATLPTLLMAWDMAQYGLRPLPPAFPVPPFRARFFWSSRTTNDPALIWVRDLVLDAYRSAHDEAEALFQGALRTGAARTPVRSSSAVIPTDFCDD
jgi:DNA-binding transcriptional LysR family regulator